MSARKHDYRALEAEYIRNEISIRALCRKHDVKAYSSVAQYARENNWEQKRSDIRARADEKLTERVADQLAETEADLVAQVRTEWLTVIRAATYKFAEDLKDPNFRISVDALIKLIDKGLVLVGEPSTRTEERHLALTGSLGELPEPFLRQLAERTRPVLAVRGRESLPSRAGTEDPRQN